MQRFIDGLKAHMAENGVTVQQIADATGTIRQNVSRILNGGTRLTCEKADAFARAAGFRFTLGDDDGEEGSEEG